jgi:membrane-bound serine protease (ClpP class)
MKNLLFAALSLLVFSVFAESKYQVNKITYLNIQASINPATLNYIEDNIKKLSREKGDMLVIKLDTPGGLVSTTKNIITLIGDSDFPVGVWITPEGASATSAGAIIASSAHVLVMNDGTNIGAATPITMGKDIEQKDARAKAINDLVALVRSLSKARGRNPEAFEKMISEAKSLGAQTALKNNVIDAIVHKPNELIQFINQTTVTIKGEKLTLMIEPNVAQNTIEMDPGQQALNIFANPTTAYILFVIGAALIYFEFQAPGGFVAGAVGVVFLLLAGIGFQVLPLNFGAMGLIILSFILFILEAFITSFGILTIGGIVSLVFGSLFLFRTDNSYIELEQTAVWSTIVGVSAYVIFLGWYLVKSYIRPKNYYSQKGEFGHVIKLLKQEDSEFFYQVKVNGEIWNAKSLEKIEPKTKIDIIESDNENMILQIKTH